MTLIVDSGGILAALDRRQKDYALFREAMEDAVGPLIISPFVVAELDHMIFDRYGRAQQLFFLGEVERGAYRLERFSTQDLARCRSLCTQYADLKGFGVADALNIVLAERYDSFDIPPRTSEISGRSREPGDGISESFHTTHRDDGFRACRGSL